MLLFVFVFGGAISAGSDAYVTYLLPGILLITVASGVSYTAFRLFTDLQSGIFERFQSLPIARPSVLWAHVLTSLNANLVSLVVVVGAAVLMGFRTGAGVGAWLAVAGILILFTLALTWLAVLPGLTAKTADGASAFALPTPSSCPSSARPSCPPTPCPARSAPSPSTSRSPPSSTPSATCSPNNRSTPTSGPPLAGVGILIIAYTLAMTTYRHKIS